ncbi:efflux RND transporter periplasmic adaptor subunit [Paenibacillus rhizovicinus]|uniref:Efflux RND transporter periplasmic adaptor subunit n=1 Tax=Paenibacillus rhizovicinus TaxID=2704463 RepID=A0A6C0P607_9BACL|nr:efflux RND transporter periplasmic adaptor subunit [Paenibacillus rhizovicinus]QHW34014.1 efflux RND transporter periplasmic adaptor subunit [Paenibacillus rhizovicinus]
MERRKRMLRWAIGLFVLALLLLTYLSTTIQTMALPKVAVEEPSMGSLDLSITEEAYLEPAYSAPLTPLGNWKVTDVHVKKGERVKKGDPLLTFDPAETERTLEDDKTRYKQQQIKLSQLLIGLKPLLREGADSDTIGKQKKDIEAQQLEMEIASRQINDLEKQIHDGRVLRAPFDGVVTTLSAEAGITVSPGQQVCVLASDTSGYQVEIPASGDAASALQIGREAEVVIDGEGFDPLTGKISGIESASEQGAASGDEAGSDAKTITIDIVGTGLSPGLKATVYIEQESGKPGFKIPVTALKADDSGAYVFTVTVKEGPLGSSYFVKKTYVETGDASDDTVVIQSGLMPEERIVTDTSEPLSDGDRVRLE